VRAIGFTDSIDQHGDGALWLIARFIDNEPEFLFVPAKEAMQMAASAGATPYDIPDVELSHVADLCSLDAFLKKYGLGDELALQQLARNVRGVDTSRLDLTPQSVGLYAISLGLSATFHNYHEMLKHSMLCTMPFTLGVDSASPNRINGRLK
jgi:hypothetical protein